jgi:hypothetical protein
VPASLQSLLLHLQSLLLRLQSLLLHLLLSLTLFPAVMMWRTRLVGRWRRQTLRAATQMWRQLAPAAALGLPSHSAGRQYVRKHGQLRRRIASHISAHKKKKKKHIPEWKPRKERKGKGKRERDKGKRQRKDERKNAAQQEEKQMHQHPIQHLLDIPQRARESLQTVPVSRFFASSAWRWLKTWSSERQQRVRRE